MQRWQCLEGLTPYIYSPSTVARFSKPVIGARGKRIVLPSSIARHDDGDRAAVLGGEVMDIVRCSNTGKYALELPADLVATLCSQRRERQS